MSNIGVCYVVLGNWHSIDAAPPLVWRLTCQSPA